MKQNRIFVLIQIILVCNGFVFAQNSVGNGEFSFVNYAPMPSLAMNGNAFTGLPTDDLNGFFINPAQIGNFAKENRFGSTFGHTDWFGTGTNFRNSVVGFGGLIPTKDHKGSLHFGVALYQLTLDMGYFEFSTGENTVVAGQIYDRANGVAAGLHFEKGIVINAGLNVRRMKYHRPEADLDPALAVDIGVQLHRPYKAGNLLLTPSGGFSMVNLGKNLEYDLIPDLRLSRPLERYARLGFGFSAELRDVYAGQEFSTISVDLSVEAREKLLIYEQNTGTRKVNYPTHFSVFDHFVKRSPTPFVDVHQGVRIQILETIRIGFGNINRDSYESALVQRGVEFSSEGIFRYLGAKNPAFNKTLQRINVQLSYVEYKSNRVDLDKNTRVFGVTVQVKR